MIRSRYGRILSIFAVLGIGGCAGMEPLPEGVDGVWEARRPGGAEHIRLDLYRGPMGRRSTEQGHLWVEFGEIEGLDRDAFHGTDPLDFRLERDVGTFHFEGKRQRRPRGTFLFEASAEFVEGVGQLGVAAIDNDRLMRLAYNGVSGELVESLLVSGYRDSDADDLLRLHDYRVNPDWITAMARLAGPPSFGELIRLRNNGVRAPQVDRWVEAGLEDLAVDDLLRLYRQGFDPDDAVEYREIGFDDTDAWLAFHRNGVPIDLIRAAGVHVLDVKDVVRLSHYGVSAGDFEAYASSGFIESDEIRALVTAGVDVKFLKRVEEAGISSLDIDDLIEASRTGLDNWLEQNEP